MILYLVSLINIVIVTLGISVTYKTLSIHLIFWLSSLFFVIVPLTIDTLILIPIDLYSVIDDIMNSITGSAKYLDVSEVDYLYISCFVCIFNAIYLTLTYIYPTSLKNDLRKSLDIQKKYIYLAFIIALAAIMLFVIFNQKPWFTTGFFVQQSPIAHRASFILMLFSGFAFIAYYKKKPLIAILLLLFPVFVTFATSVRLYALAPSGVLFFIILYKYHNRIIYGLPILLICSIIVIFLLTSARLLAADKEIDFLSILLQRDSSIFSLYFVSANLDKLSGLTKANGLYEFLTTGWYPDFLDPRAISNVDITGLLSEKERGWDRGGVHPTVYGWSIVDLGFLGVLFGGFLYLVVTLPFIILRKLCPALIPSYIAIASMFIALAVRGTVQRGFGYFVFYIVILMIMGFIIKIILDTFRQQHCN